MFRQKATIFLRLRMKMVQIKLGAFTHSETFPERRMTEKPCATGISKLFDPDRIKTVDNNEKSAVCVVRN